jgi:hypothetical protein
MPRAVHRLILLSKPLVAAPVPKRCYWSAWTKKSCLWEITLRLIALRKAWLSGPMREDSIDYQGAEPDRRFHQERLEVYQAGYGHAGKDDRLGNAALDKSFRQELEVGRI